MGYLCQYKGKKNKDSPALWIPGSCYSPVSKVPGNCNSPVSKVPGSHLKSAINLWKYIKKIKRPINISNGTRINWLMEKPGAKISWDCPLKVTVAWDLLKFWIANIKHIRGYDSTKLLTFWLIWKITEIFEDLFYSASRI